VVDKETRRSRRARRREEQDANEATEGSEAAEASADEAEAGGEPDADGSAEDAEDGSQEEEAASAAEADDEDKPARPRPAPRKKKKKRKRSGEPDRIRDRNERIRERAAARRRERDQGLAAGEMVDDALARWTQTTTNWVKDHFNIVQWVVVALIAGGIGWEIYSWRHTKQIEKASDKLIAAVEDEAAKLPGEEASGPEADFDPRKTFPTAKARNQAAEKSYQAAATVAKGSGTSILATLGLAGVEYDQGKFGAAQKDYESVKGSALAKHDTDVKGRSIEGIGMCLEADKKLDAAAKAYRELENMGVPGLTSLALYHQARVAYLKGAKDQAQKLLQKVQKKLSDTDSPYPQNSYLATMSTQLMQTINPSAAPAPEGPGMQLTPQQIQKLREQIKQDPTKLKELMQKMGMKLPPAPKGAPGPAEQAPAPAPDDTSKAAAPDETPAPEKTVKPKAPAPEKTAKPKAPAPEKTVKPKAPAPEQKPTPAPAPAGSAP
jgi:predicted negative regulator of RcsB-dependent stress response